MRITPAPSKEQKKEAEKDMGVLPHRFNDSDPDNVEGQVDPLDHHAQAKAEGVKPAFLAKVEVLNQAIMEIGMGRFQYELFFTAGKCHPSHPTYISHLLFVFLSSCF